MACTSKPFRSTWIAILGVALAVAPAVARADGADKPNAEELTNQAYELYKKGSYPQALSTYQRAYQISAATPILFNIANIYDRKLHERELASEYYRRYLRSSDVEPDLVRRANERLEAMKEEAEALRRNTPTPVKADAPGDDATKSAAATARMEPTSAVTDEGTREGRSPLRTAGFVTVGVGAVGLVVGGVFGAMAMSKNDEAASLCEGKACSSPRALELTDSARSSAGVSTAAFVVGGVLAAGGVTLILLAPKAREGTASGANAAAPRFVVGPGSVGVSGTF